MAGRRGHGDGSIYERTVGGKLQYVGQISLGRVDGKRIRLAAHGATKAEVRAKLKEIQRNFDAGLAVTQAPTVGEWLTKWLSQLEAGQKKRYATMRRYRSLSRVHLIPGLGHHRIDKLSRVHVDDFLAAKLNELAPRTVHHLRAVLRTALNRAVKDGLILRNASGLTEAVDVPDQPRRFLSTDEARALLGAATSERVANPSFATVRNEALYALALNTGLRIGEALALRWQDVEPLDKGELSVVYNLQRVRGKLDPKVEPKTRKSRRSVGLPPSVVQTLLGHRQSQREEKIRLRPIWQDSDLIFTSQIGSPLDPSDVSRDFRAFLARHELPRIRFHDLRHAAGSIMLKNGIPMYTVSRILGHSNIATTVDTYGHVEEKAFDEAAAAMGRALGG
jgi:integrase